MEISLLVNTDKQSTIFAEKYFDRLRKLGNLRIYDKRDFLDKNYVLNFVKDSDIIIISWGSPKIDKEILDAAPNLKAVLHAAGSIKPYITDEFLARNIRATNSAAAIGEGVAESALGFAISACKRFYWLSQDTKNGLWSNNSKTVVDFYDLTIGVISGGFVGRHFIKLLKNFNVDILLYDPTMSEEAVKELGATKAELNELLSKSNVISIHAPSIPATNNMINSSNLPLIKDGAVLINTARGSIIDEPALIEELKKNRFFACIDVTSPEPPTAENGLRFLDNVVLTPHVAGTTTNGLRRIALHICEELERFKAGEKMRTEIDFSNIENLA